MAEEIQPAAGSTDPVPTVAASGEKVQDITPDTTSGNESDKGSVESGTTPTQKESIAGLDLSAIPEESRDIVRTWAQKREDDQLRFVAKKAQTYAEDSGKVKAYDEFVANELESYKAWKSGQTTSPTPQAEPEINPALVQSYVNAGYSQDEATQMASTVVQTVRQELAVQKKSIDQSFNQQQQTYQKMQSRQLIDDLASQFPDVNEGIKDGTFIPFVQHYCRAEGQPLEVAYQKWSELRNAGVKKARQSQQDRIQEKKNASSVTRTPANNAEVVYVDNPKLLNRIAAQYAQEGKKVQVRLKKK